MTALLIVDDAGKQIVREVALLQLIDLTKHQTFHLVEALAFLGGSHQEEGTVVVKQFRTAAGPLYLHGLIQVEVKESGTSVAQHILHQFEGVGLQSIGLLCPPSHPDGLCLLSDDSGILRLCQRSQRCKLRLRDICPGFPTREILVDDGDGLVWIEVTRHTDSHIIRPVPLVKVVLDVRDGGVLQVLLRTDRRLKSVWMIRPEHLTNRIKKFALILGQTDIILLIDGLKLRMETTDHHVLETVTLDSGPVLDLIRGDVLRIAGHIVRGVGIRPFGTDGSHQFVILIGNEILGSHLTN